LFRLQNYIMIAVDEISRPSHDGHGVWKGFKFM